MGYELKKMTLSVEISRHNSPRDTRDEGLWQAFCAEVKMLSEDSRYLGLGIDLDGYPGSY